MMTEDALGLAELVRSGQASPRELVEAAIERIEKLDPQLNAVPIRFFDHARATTPEDGPFKGVPFLLKDVGAPAEGLAYYCGSRFLRDRSYIARYDSAVASRFRAAGFVFLGRTNVPECALNAITEPEVYGPCRNPWDPDVSPGGSSGGAGAAVASGMVPAAHANDGGGSIRIPAGACGLVGLKPSRGRVSNAPDNEIWGGLAIDHALTRTVRDTAAILDVLAGPEPGDPYTAPHAGKPFASFVGTAPPKLTVGVCTSPRERGLPIDPNAAAAVHEAAKALESLGHTIVDDYPSGIDDADIIGPFATIVGASTKATIAQWTADTGDAVDRERDLEPTTRYWLTVADMASADEYVLALEAVNAFRRRFAAWFTNVDLLLTPTAGSPSWGVGEYPADPMQVTPDQIVRATAQTCFTVVYNLSGQPAISLPTHEADGMPVGVMLGAAYGREDLLLQVASQLEAAMPWKDRTPRVHA